MTLTPAQRGILRQMAAGWELRHNHIEDTWHMLTWKPSVQVKSVTNSARVLQKKGLVAKSNLRQFGTTHRIYRLTDAGREAAKGE